LSRVQGRRMKILVLVCLFAGSAAQAALDWERKECCLVAHPTQVSVTAVFKFVNAGEKTVTIAEMQTRCGCLSSRLKQRSFASGEAGELVVDLDLRNRIGRQGKTLVVRTDDGVSTKLHVACEIPRAYVAEPRRVLWRKGDDAASKTVRLLNSGTLPIKLLSITSSCDGLPAELKPVREGFEYAVVITRKPDITKTRSVVRIATEPPPGLSESKPIKLYVHVQ